MLIPIRCLTCGKPLQQLEERYYRFLDNEKARRNRFLESKEASSLISQLEKARYIENKKDLTDLEKALSEHDNKDFKELFIELYEDNQRNLPEFKGTIAKELYLIYKNTPEFLALESVGLGPKKYCCRSIFLCHPRVLFDIVQ